MELKNLIGYKLLKGNSEMLTIAKDENSYELLIQEDEGKEYGFNNIEVEFNIQNNPTITNVTIERTIQENGEMAKVTFFDTNKIIGIINTYSSNENAHDNTTCVLITCQDLKLKEIISKW